MMKNLLFALWFIPFLLQGQETCSGIENRSIFHANRIGAVLYPHGYKFYGDDGFFKVPYTSQSSASSIFASNAWIGAYRNGQLKIAAQGYATDLDFEYQVGPLLEDGSSLDSACLHYNHIWSVKRTDISRHIQDFESDGIIDDTLAAIFGWPSEGNLYFKMVNSFSLPSSHQGGWADFFDKNQNGRYEPESGEYPCIYLNGEAYIPEVMMWMVYNDQGPHTTSQGEPLGVEIQLTVYGFNCIDHPVLNSALFNTYKVINQQDQLLDSAYFGMWTDYDLGCAYDDYFGCDTSRHTEFVYNSDGMDGDVGFDCINGSPVYGGVPPIQSFTYLSHPMFSFSDGRIHDSIAAPGFYNALKGLWPDGTPITVFEQGYNPGSPLPTTKFLYSGDPRDTAQWSMASINVVPGDKGTLSSIRLGQLAPYEAVRIDGAYIFHHDSSTAYHLDMLSLMHDQVDELRAGYVNGNLSCTPFQDCLGTDCVWPGDYNHDGKADHFDVMSWGAAKDQQGAVRNGLFEWDGYHADPWPLDLPGGLNAKHADGNGDGIVNIMDIERNLAHFGLTNPIFEEQHQYPPGPHLYLTAQYITSEGSIRNLRIQAGQEIPNVLGLAYEIEFDTSLFAFDRIISIFPADSNFLAYNNQDYGDESPLFNYDPSYAFVQTDHQPILIEKDFFFQRSVSGGALILKPGLNPDNVPDSTVIRLRNLIAIDADGNNLHIGSEPLVVYKEGIVGSHDPAGIRTQVFPNPCRNEVMIVTDTPADIFVFNIQGQIVKVISANDLNHPVDISDLAPGMYLLQVGQGSYKVKLIIH